MESASKEKDASGSDSENEEREGRERQPRYPFDSGHPLCKTHAQRLRVKCAVPVLAGAPPPLLPNPAAQSEHAVRARERWTAYWSFALVPWSGDEIPSYDFESFSALVNRWHRERDTGTAADLARGRARFVLLSTHTMRANKSRVMAVNLYRLGARMFETNAAGRRARRQRRRPSATLRTSLPNFARLGTSPGSRPRPPYRPTCSRQCCLAPPPVMRPGHLRRSCRRPPRSSGGHNGRAKDRRESG